MKLDQLLQDFHEQRLQLPLMQRDYCWDHKKVELLLESLFRGWPIGCFYVWKSTQAQRTRSQSHRRQTTIEHQYLLDGQQRLVSLQRALSDDDTLVAGRAFFDIHRGLESPTRAFRVVRQNANAQNRPRWVNDPTCVPLSGLISIDGSVDASVLVSTVCDKLLHSGVVRRGALDAVRSSLTTVALMLKNDVECRTYRTDSLDDAIEIFTRLNSGKGLKKADKIAAELARDTSGDVLEHMRKFASQPDIRRYGWGSDFLTRSLVTMHRGDATLFTGTGPSRKMWQFSTRSEARQAWSQTERALGRVTEVLKSIGWTNRRWLPSANMLIPVAYALRDTRRELTGDDVDAIRSYLGVTAVSGVTQGTVESTINHYLKPFKRNGSPSTDELWYLWYAIPEERRQPIRWQAVRNSWSRNSALMKVFLAYLVDNGARSWPDLRPLSRVVRSDGIGDVDVHHIFPQQLKQGGGTWKHRDLNTMANYAVLAESGNRELRDMHPRDVFAQLPLKAREDAVFQFIRPAMESDIEHDRYEDFCVARAKAIADGLNKFLWLPE